MFSVQVLVELAVGLLVGVLSGLFGIGGGVVLVPAMALLLGVDQHVAQGVSLVVIVPTAIVGAVTHYRHGNVEPRLALFLGLTAVVGAIAGAWASSALDAYLLRKAFGLLVLYTAYRMISSELRRKG